MNLGRILFVVCVFYLFVLPAKAQEDFDFTTIVDIKTTQVKDQGHSGTCWAYSTTSFLEAEIIRMGGPELDLSEMYFVNYTYRNKAQSYVRYHGNTTFGQGGLSHDVINVMDKYGVVLENDYPENKVSHNELAIALKSLLDGYVKQTNAKPSFLWFENIRSMLINYLGEMPAEIKYNKRYYSPLKFMQGFGLESSNYIEFTSYQHHPFYKSFALEVPDNWSNDLYYNLPVDELLEVMKSALISGYTIAWDGDVSDQFFSGDEKVALYPVEDSLGFIPQKEKEVSQEDRQEAFDRWEVTDDHMMHIVGMVTDQNGTVYFKTKNSWGNEKHNSKGYVFLSESYVRLHTLAIMLHKNGIPKDIQKKLNL
jgi:bleomycin hydrolase